MTDALMPRPTQPLPDDRKVEPGKVPSVSEPQVDLRRLYIYCSLLLLALGFFMAASSWAAFGREEGMPEGLFTQTDFPAVVIASRLIASGLGSQLYEHEAQLAGQHQLTRQAFLHLRPDDPILHYPYPYTPFLALAWAPFTTISPLVAMAVWDLLNLAALAVGLWVLLVELALPRIVRLLLMLGALTSLPSMVNLEQGQSSGVVALGLALGVVGLRRYHDFGAGLWLGLLLVKVQWLPLTALVLALKGRWRALGGLAAVGAALALETTLVIGREWVPAYAGVLATASSSGSEYLLTPAASHSLNGGIYALLGPGNASLVGLLTLLGTLAVVALVVGMWLYTPRVRLFTPLHLAFTWQPGTPAWDARMALTLLAIIFTNPQLNTHDLSLLILPAALGFAALYGLRAERPTRFRPSAQPGVFPILWQACLWLIYFTPLLLLGAILDPINPLPIRLTTWLMALMLGLLAALGVRAIREA